MRPCHVQVLLRNWTALLFLSLVPSRDTEVPLPPGIHYLQACRGTISGQFIQHIRFSNQGDHLPGTFLVLALKSLISRKPLSPRQTRTTGHPIIFHVLIEPEETLEITVIPFKMLVKTEASLSIYFPSDSHIPWIGGDN